MLRKLRIAIAYMMKKHSGQRRRDGSEYFYHPLRVARAVKSLGEDFELTALFHDLLEDTDATKEDILMFSNENVLKAVELLTKDGRPPEKYINDILVDDIAKAVKNADRIDNLTDAQSSDIEFISRYLEDTRKYYLGKFSKELDEAYYDLKKVYDEYAEIFVIN